MNSLIDAHNKSEKITLKSLTEGHGRVPNAENVLERFFLDSLEEDVENSVIVKLTEYQCCAAPTSGKSYVRPDGFGTSSRLEDDAVN